MLRRPFRTTGARRRCGRVSRGGDCPLQGDWTARNGESMTKIHLIGGEKGGVGKSVVARLLAQYFIDHQLSFLGFDSDRSHGALSVS